ncbi:hypothetical protein BCR33DRAFT_720128 [Rhizoclosmatium globosum]|uniref:Uncharacterized protein n=1 Tax=Rhizoclosmatium globosum TaxID=329046 RepID=A0A1Y2BWZ7_9FUNG|nr:hypothetical protein BCR33DRAFT_720128 [Rhizoclosmatium globosum]|eukprot:ORY39290.1 hypothetical protein BCR33DRAFT_720128 [Rhizoclosmatium globosum]
MEEGFVTTPSVSGQGATVYDAKLITPELTARSVDPKRAPIAGREMERGPELLVLGNESMICTATARPPHCPYESGE